MPKLRLNKILAQAGLSSRRGGDRLIADGRVAVNGVVTQSPATLADPELDTITWVSLGIVAANLLWIAPTVYFVMQSVANSLLQKIKNNSDDITNILTTIYGAGSLVLDAILDVLSPPDAAQIVAGLLLPIPSIFSFANLSTFRYNSDIAPFAIGAKVTLDLVGYDGGGMALVIDATEQMNQE